MSTPARSNIPDLATIERVAGEIAPYVVETPCVPYYGACLPEGMNPADIILKLELMQRTGSFKARGAVNVVQSLSDEQKSRGITAFSAGNHAMATAYAASVASVSAKVAMPVTANPYRVERCRDYAAEIEFADDIGQLLAVVERLQHDEGRTLVHPFEGENTTLGTATLGRELCLQDTNLDAVIVPVGGGGLISGIALAVARMMPNCKVYGVEPTGANGMQRSLLQNSPLSSVDVNTIADSLGAPLHLPYSFSLVKEFVQEIVTVTDTAIAESMRLMFEDLKLAVEPAAAAALAALTGPLRQRLEGQRVGIIVCGSNIDLGTHRSILEKHLSD